MSKAIQFKNKSGENVYPCPYYPVGSIYISTNSTNPGNIFGGTWEQIKDKFLLACGSTYSNGSTGGEATHKLTVAEIPSHSHGLTKNVPYGLPYNYTSGNRLTSSGNGEFFQESYSPFTVGNTGGGGTHNNMPPYIAVYMWKRVS
jgi:hypothetical protein